MSDPAGPRTCPAPPAAPDAPPPDADACAVLLVDPDANTRSRYARALRDAGYCVWEASTTDEAIHAIAHASPAVVVLDAELQDAHRWQARAQRLRVAGAFDCGFVVLLPDSPAPDLLETPERTRLLWQCKSARPEELVLRVRLSNLGHGAPATGDLRGDQAHMWNVLLDFSRSMGRVTDLDTILRHMVLAAAEMTCCRRVSIMLPDESHEHLRIAWSIGIDETTRAATRVPIGEGIAGRVFLTGQRRTAVDTADTIGRSGQGRTFASIPIIASLHTADESVGVLNITHRYDDRPFADWELEFLDMLASVAGSVIDDSLWRRTRESLLKYERDHHLARRIQQGTFPRTLPHLGGFSIDGWSEPAEQTAGDTYDIVPVHTEGGAASDSDAERVVLLLADATGHGIGPALSVTQVRAMLRMALRIEPDLVRIAGHMNEQLCDDLPGGRFITAWLGDLDPSSRTLTSFSAGQGPILRYDARRDAVEIHPADTLPLGILPDLEMTPGVRMHLHAGDIVAVLSDGIFEAANPTGQRFGTERVCELMRQHRDLPPPRFLETLRSQLADFCAGVPADDDRTAVVIHCTA